MGVCKNVFKEIRKQLTSTPSFFDKATSAGEQEFFEIREDINLRIENAMQQNSKSIIFLLAPFGGGKTSQLHYFRQKYAHLNFIYRSFLKIRSLDFAFMHMTPFWGRLGFILLGLGVCFTIMEMLPTTGALPFLLAIAYFFSKDVASLMYTFHETFDNLLVRRDKIVIIDDLERSPLSSNEQWALLANLWKYKRKYLVSLGYSPDERKEKLKLLEYVIKLGGVLIEMPSNEEVNVKFMKKLDPLFPFEFTTSQENIGLQWLSLFTPRELEMVQEEVSIQCNASQDASALNRQISYVETCLDLLSKKIGLGKEEIFFDRKECEIKSIPIALDKMQFIKSFTQSIIPTLSINLHQIT